MLHCCGSIHKLLPDLLDGTGLDAINPVQVTAAGMEPAALKRDFGNKVTFWGGGCETRFTLPCGTPQQVREHVREQVAMFRPGGGFVFQSVHNILADVPPQNIVAMYDALKKNS
jgi:uroporphyrinogen decarboxylase